MTTTPAPRRRRMTADPARAGQASTTSPRLRQNNLEAEVDRVFSLKVAADEATAAYGKARKRLYENMREAKRTEIELPATDNRPAIVAREMQKTLGEIDPVAFKKQVTADEFMACINVTQKEAAKFLGTTALDNITKKTPGSKYLEVRTLAGRKSR